MFSEYLHGAFVPVACLPVPKKAKKLNLEGRCLIPTVILRPATLATAGFGLHWGSVTSRREQPSRGASNILCDLRARILSQRRRSAGICCFAAATPRAGSCVHASLGLLASLQRSRCRTVLILSASYLSLRCAGQPRFALPSSAFDLPLLSPEIASASAFSSLSSPWRNLSRPVSGRPIHDVSLRGNAVTRRARDGSSVVCGRGRSLHRSPCLRSRASLRCSLSRPRFCLCVPFPSLSVFSLSRCRIEVQQADD